MVKLLNSTILAWWHIKVLPFLEKHICSSPGGCCCSFFYPPLPFIFSLVKIPYFPPPYICLSFFSPAIVISVFCPSSACLPPLPVLVSWEHQSCFNSYLQVFSVHQTAIVLWWSVLNFRCYILLLASQIRREPFGRAVSVSFLCVSSWLLFSLFS
jgi:hypothetical protein